MKKKPILSIQKTSKPAKNLGVVTFGKSRPDKTKYVLVDIKYDAKAGKKLFNVGMELLRKNPKDVIEYVIVKALKNFAGACLFALATSLSMAESGFDAFKANYMCKEIRQIHSPGMTEAERQVRMAQMEYNAIRFYRQLTDENKFVWEWEGRYGINATQSDREKMKSYRASHFSLGRRISNQTYEDWAGL